jgi:hypothetical protein
MSYQFEIDRSERVVYFSASGVFTSEELFSCIQEVVADPDFEPGYNHLVDLREVEQHVTRGEEIARRVAFDKAMAERIGNAKFALVSSALQVYGMTKMYEILAKEAPFDVQTFVSMSEARLWLGLPKERNKA